MMPEAGAELTPGMRLGPYEVIGPVGSGGMGAVFRARDTRLDRTVAIKVSAAQFSGRFEREARAVAALNHPHICTLYDVGPNYLVMEFVEGETLAGRLRQGPLPMEEVVRYGTEIADALTAAHARGVIHRDLKPSNIMITGSGVKVLDFGLAKLAPAGASDETLTASKVVMGTPAYMAPEQLEGKECDARTDIFALGLALYEMASGRRAFTAESQAGLMAAILRSEPVALKGVSPHFSEIVRRCLTKDPGLRWQSAAEVRIALQRCVAAAPPRVLKAPVLWITVAILVIAGAAYYFFAVERSPGIDSLAVLPFVNAGSDPNLEYLSDGIAEMLINDLSQLPKLRVTARSTAFHYKNREFDPEKMGRELHVKAVLTGRVVERAGNLSIQVDLLDASNGSELWGRQYSETLSDILVVQEEIARQISEKLRLRLTGEDKKRLARHPTENTEAYQLYLKGLYHWNRRTAGDLQESVRNYEQAIALDPTYALAYAGLAGSYDVMSQYAGTPAKEVYPKAEEAARHAIQIDDGIAPAHAFLGYARFAYDWDWAGAGREFQRAIDLDPNLSTTHLYYSIYLIAIGRTEQAIAEARRAQALDPLSLITHATAGLVLIHARRHDEAIAQCRRALDLDPNFAAGHWYLGMAYIAKGYENAAIDELQKAINLGGSNSQYVGSLAAALAAGGRTAEARDLIPRLVSMGGDSATSYQLSLIYLSLGDKNRALDFLEKAYEEHAFQLCMAKSQPYLDPLRSEPRFIALIQRLNFPK